MAEAEPRGRGRGRAWGRSGGRGGMKRPMHETLEYEDYSDGYSKKRKIMDDVYRFLVREDLVRVVIGKGGENIREIKDEAKEEGIETKVSIYAQNSNGEAMMDGAVDRVMSIQSTEDGLAMALHHIVPRVQTHRQLQAGRGRGRGGASMGGQRRVKLELRLMVPAHCCSGIIGRGGCVIKKIKEETNSYVQVYTLPLPNSEEHCIRIQNFEANELVSTAVKVFQSIAEIKGKNPVTMYDPIYFEHGEYGDTGSYIDTEWYQEALRSGVAKPTPYKQIRSAAAETSYPADPYAGGYEESSYEESGYEEYSGYDYEEAEDYEEWYYPPPRPRRAAIRGRGLAAPRRAAPRAAPFRARGLMAGGRGSRGGAPHRALFSRGGPRGAPRGA